VVPIVGGQGIFFYGFERIYLRNHSVDASATNLVPGKKKYFFLKQRLKHPLEWIHDPRSGLLFSGTDKQEIKIRPLSFFREKHL
jgi:hypothetical protein